MTCMYSFHEFEDTDPQYDPVRYTNIGTQTFTLPIHPIQYKAWVLADGQPPNAGFETIHGKDMISAYVLTLCPSQTQINNESFSDRPMRAAVGQLSMPIWKVFDS